MKISMRPLIVVLGFGLLAGGLTTSARQAAPPVPAPLPKLTVPAGFQAEVFAEGVENARSMALGAQGTVFVGSQYVGKVHAVVDRDSDHKADRVVLIASGLDQPNGLAMRNGALYVATASRLLRFDNIEKHLDAPPAPVTIRNDLPNPKRGHTWKYIAFGPDDMLYMSVGAPCNVCLSEPFVSAIVRMKPDGTGMETFAEGVRNSVGFDWHPVTRELWFTENGRDGMGDDVPGDELNVAPKAGLHFGFPYCHQDKVVDPEFGGQRACSTTEPPALTLGAHVAAIGFTFYTGNMFPAVYRNAAIIAEHGSWNRSIPSGYRVMTVRTEGRRATSYEPLVEGFLPVAVAAAAGGRGATKAALGRPADVLQMPDGSILISDDRGRLIRVSYRAQTRAEITINDTGVQSENLTSTKDGTVYFGSMAKGTIYRALPGASQAEPWIQGATNGLHRVLGVLAHEESNTLWVCNNNTGGGRDGSPVVGQTGLRSFDLKSGAPTGDYPFPTNGQTCNDMAVAANGTVYATESFSNRIYRLRPGAKAVDLWIEDAKALAIPDGIAILADGAVYVNLFFTGQLVRIPVNADGSAGAIEPIETSLPLTRPDGLRTIGPTTMIQAEGSGRVAELTIKGNRAEVRVLQEGFKGTTGVTVVGNTAYVLFERAKAVAVPR
jgi:glucose/arabinose dehydrogenase